jgi:Uma2 family endonuclease
MDMSPIGPFHGGVTRFLIEFFTDASKKQWITDAQNPVLLDDHSEPQPDLMLLKRSAGYYKKRQPTPTDVFLLVEISDSSLERDHEVKLPAYARSGIAEVWIVDLNEQTIEVYRQPHFAGYGSKIVLSAGQKASPQAFPDVSLDVGELLKR